MLAIAVVCGYGLATRLFPDHIGVFDPIAVYRLSEPVGYWNTMGLVAGMGAILAFGFASRARYAAVRALAAASLVPFVATAYFTFGRAALLTLGAGLVLSLDPRRLQAALTLAVAAPFLAVTVWSASGLEGLTHADAQLRAAADDGHRFFFVLLAIAGATAVSSLVLVWAERRVQPGRNVRRAWGGARRGAARGAARRVRGLRRPRRHR